ncbi:MAG: 2-oxo-4-hydroxy-4-carboxy-5-ureidoimidazoline decarboxylase [Humibacillus sp.]
MTGVEEFNALPADEARVLVTACLGVPRFADEVVGARPYADVPALLAAAGVSASDLADDELAAALAGHPRVGERAANPPHQAAFSRREQSGVDPTDEQVAADLAAGNAAYEERFDRVFLIRAAERAETATQLREIALLRLREVAR